jgi:hypothetical protein
MTHWRRQHVNAWSAEVQTAPDGRFYHRTYEQRVIPAHCTESEASLPLAQQAADALVPGHECHCAEWTEWL